MKPITLHPHEIRRLIDTGSVTVWRPMKPQPRWDTLGGFEAWECKGGHVHVWDEDRDPDEVAFVNQCAPHPPGSERWVRETWRGNTDGELEIAINYQVDDTVKDFYIDQLPRDVYQLKLDWAWRSPATMPRWASRLSVVAKAVQARQVESVTEEEAVEAGLADLIAFSEWWRWRFDTLGPDPWAWATKMERKEG